MDTNAYDDAYEAELRTLLADWIDRALAGGSMQRVRASEAAGSRHGWGEFGPLSYHLRNCTDSIVAAEYDEYLAKSATTRLAANHAPSAVLASLHRECRAMVGRGLAASSTNEMSNMLERMLAQRAYQHTDDDRYGGLGTLARTAASQAAHRVVPDGSWHALRARSDQARELQTMIERARSDSRRAELQGQLAAKQAEVQACQRDVRSLQVAAGVPPEHLQAVNR